MTRSRFSKVALLALLCAATPWLALSVLHRFPELQTPVSKEQADFFEARIRPVLVEKCIGCHGASVQMSGLRLDSTEAIRKGGSSGPAIVAGDPEKSLLIQAIHQSGPIKMPQGGKLSDAEIADFEAWVKMGAPWPSSASEPAGRALWSLKPLKKPTVPKVKGATRVVNPIDAFVLAKLEAKKQTLSPEADRRTLIRRLSYDLIGLPPTAAEVDAFLADKAPHAYEKVVDRLLASPHYGERWARHWLDVARYADTKGYVFEEERVYFNAYTYRDWVIEAFNKDLPYDHFILQQLAADRLPEVQADNKKPLAALGFLTVGRRFLNNPHDIIDDRIDVTMRGFQGFTVACARCHDHKFDPIPTQDYYSLYAVFASSQELETPISEKAVRGPWLAHAQQVQALQRKFRQLVVVQTRRLRQLNQSPESGLSAEVKRTLQALREEVVPEGEVLGKLAKAFEPAEVEQIKALQKELEELGRKAPPVPEFAMAMMDRPNPTDGAVFKRGNPGVRGEPAPRRFLSALSKSAETREHWKSGSGRLELAKAIASRENPLTARVFVNRVWQHHFGEGLVRTPSDFGHQGEKPTHPELLDYVASAFMESGWSVKKLHKLIVQSATYRQSSKVSPATYRSDPENRTLNRMNRRRLDLEQMRDSILLASGLLDLSKVGGKSVPLWAEPYSTRRSVYGFIERQNLPAVFRTFDFASPDITNARRFLTTVPQQALFLMNSPFSVEQARKVGERTDIRSATTEAERVRKLYRLLFVRQPDSEELAAGVSFLRQPPDPNRLEDGWEYGYGAIDPFTQQVSEFKPLAHYADGGYRAGKAFPDPKLGYLLLNAQGGHPGQNAEHSIIRRWRAAADAILHLGGTLTHQQTQGDGVRARIVSSRLGTLGNWRAHNGNATTEVKAFEVRKGDTIDFVVDPIGSHDFDGFGWLVTVRTSDGREIGNSQKDFGPPPARPLSRLALYAQALMMTNEFMFVD